jgi:hypothetical protein
MLAVFFLASAIMIDDGRFITFSGKPDIAAIGGALIANVVGAFQIVMTAVILSRSYMMAEGAAGTE